MIAKDAVLDYNGFMHRLDSVISSAKTTNFKTKVDIKDIHQIFDQHRAAVRIWPADFEMPVDAITVLYKFEGKYIMLTNSHKVNIGDKGEVVGYVISSVGLKKCRILDDQIPLTVPQATLNAYNEERSKAGNTNWFKHAGTTLLAEPPRPVPARPDEFRNKPRFVPNKPTRSQYG